MGLGRCLWFISPPQLDKVEHRLSGVQSRGPHLPQFMALAWVGQCPMPLGPFVLQEYQRPSLVSTPQQRTYSWKFIKCAEQRPPFARIPHHWRPTPFHRRHACIQNLSGVQSRWHLGNHLPQFMALPWVQWVAQSPWAHSANIPQLYLHSTGPSQEARASFAFSSSLPTFV